MIDARTALGVPCITTCPIMVPRSFVVAVGVELDEWQQTVMRGHGFILTDEDN